MAHVQRKIEGIPRGRTGVALEEAAGRDDYVFVEHPEGVEAPDDTSRAFVTLTSKDGDQFEVAVSVAEVSELVKQDMKDEIALPQVTSRLLAKVLEFCRHQVVEPMAEIQKPLRSADMRENVQEWYAAYIDVDQELLFELVLAANYMRVAPLVALASAAVAAMLKGKSPQEIRRVFGADCSPEEGAQVRHG